MKTLYYYDKNFNSKVVNTEVKMNLNQFGVKNESDN